MCREKQTQHEETRQPKNQGSRDVPEQGQTLHSFEVLGSVQVSL